MSAGRTKVPAPPAVTSEEARTFASAITAMGPNYCPSLALEASWNEHDGLGFIAWGAPNSEDWPHTVGNPF